MEQIAELFFVASFGVRASGAHHAHPCFLENAHDVVCGSFPFFAEVHDQLPPDLLDFCRRVSRLGKAPRCLQDQLLLGGGSGLMLRIWMFLAQEGPRCLVFAGSESPACASFSRRW